MAKKIHKQENILDDSIYEKDVFPFKRIIIIVLVLIPLGFILNFPVKEVIRGLVIQGLSSNTSCPILYNDVEVSYFFPKIIIKSPTITQACVNSLEENLNIEDIVIRPHLPSFKLPGIRLSVNIRKDKTNLYLYPVIGNKKFQLTIDDSVIHSDQLTHFMGGMDILDGTFNLSLNAEMTSSRLKKATIKLESRNLYIQSANIGSFIIPQIALMNFSLRATINSNNTLRVKPGNLVIGNPHSPIYTNLGGTISMKKQNFSSSMIDMQGDIILTNKFLELFPIIRLKLSRNAPDGNYKFVAKGKISNLGSYNFH